MSIGLDFVPNVQVSPYCPPAAAAAGGGLYLVWKDPGNGFIWTNKLSGGGWSSSSEFQARPGAGSQPAITSQPAGYNGEAFLVWQGAPEAPTAIFMAFVSDSNYGPQGQLILKNGTPATKYPPAAASFKNMLFVAWIEANSPGGSQIYIASFNPTGGWQTMQAVPLPDGVPTTQGEGTLALAADDNNLVLAWVTGGEGIKWATSSDGVKWTASAAVDTEDTSLCAPVVLPYQGRTCLLAYSVKNKEIVLKSYDGKSWTGESAIPFAHTPTVSYPAAATYQNILHVFWGLSNGQVAWVQFDGFTPDAPPSPLPPNISNAASKGFGSGATNANFNTTLTLNADGTAEFSGTWNDTGSVLLVTSPTQNYTVQWAVLASDNTLFTFSHSGSAPSAKSDSWSETTQNDELKDHWQAIAIGTYWKVFAEDNSSLPSVLESFVQAVGEIAGVAIEIFD